MDRKKESRQDSGKRQTGGKDIHKNTKRKRIIIAELVSKWTPPVEVLSLERGAV